jgi:hypothetical protein
LTRMAINVQFVWLHFTYFTVYDKLVHTHRHGNKLKSLRDKL